MYIMSIFIHAYIHTYIQIVIDDPLAKMNWYNPSLLFHFITCLLIDGIIQQFIMHLSTACNKKNIEQVFFVAPTQFYNYN